MIVVPSIMPSTSATGATQLRRLRRRAELVEIRIDGIHKPNLSVLLRRPRPAVIITNRAAHEGGKYRGSKTELFDILVESIRLGAEYIDVEYSQGVKLIQQLFETVGRERIILSYHNTHRTPKNLAGIYRKILRLKPAVAKIAVMNTHISDQGAVLRLLDHKPNGQDVVAIGMGNFGVPTRILQGIYGGFITYGAFPDDSPTAAGQPSYQDLIRLYRIHQSDASTRVFGLLGNPVSHSRGIFYHNYIFSRNHTNAVYVNFLVDNLNAFLNIFLRRVTGLSVTMPFKREILHYLDTQDAATRLTGVANTIVRKGSKLAGLNTDYAAMVSLLKKRNVRLERKRAVIVGTGSIARTIAAAFAKGGAVIAVIGRDVSGARALAREFGGSGFPLEYLNDQAGDVLVNATPLGMPTVESHVSRTNGLSHFPMSGLQRYRLVIDCAYSWNGETPLIAKAREKGCLTISGKEFFLAQAKLQSVEFLKRC